MEKKKENDDKNMIKGVSEYIKRINDILQKKDNGYVNVFRGEAEDFIMPGCPGIFRGNHLKNKYFEKSILLEMRANNLTRGNNYLEMAVDAQHDGFPSRLLDVTYNCLVALYFAVTPYYHKPIDSLDEKNGQVIVYSIKKTYCASAGNIIETFEAIVDRDEEKKYVFDESFKTNHKLINHIRMNQRIIAQQGAFILFQGDEWFPISEKDYEIIKIDKDAKPKIRNELNTLFGIHTGAIYPEAMNLVEKISGKAENISNDTFSKKNEIALFFENMRDEIEYYTLKLYNAETEKKVEVLCKCEDVLLGYKESLMYYLEEHIDPDKEKIVNDYNCLITEYEERLEFYCNKEITGSIDELRI